MTILQFLMRYNANLHEFASLKISYNCIIFYNFDVLHCFVWSSFNILYEFQTHFHSLVTQLKLGAAKCAPSVENS